MTIHPQLQQLLQNITRHHPWYTDLLQQYGVTPEESRETQLEELPLLTAELLELYYFAQSNRPEPGLSVYRTSGTSTGIRKSIYYSHEDDVSYIESKSDSFRNWLGSGENSAVQRALADLGTGHAASTALMIFEGLGMEAQSISFNAPIEEHIAKLKAFKPELLYTMPSILESIASAASHPNQLGIRKIIIVGEIATLEWQANIAARFGIAAEDILDTYGSIEIGAIASYSHKYGVYVLADGLYGEALEAESIDSRFKPLRSNEHVLVLTSSARNLFPAIRYVTYDVVRDFRTMEIEGYQRQTFRCISKRIGTELKHGEKISLYDIESVVNRFLNDAELRVRLKDNKLFVHIKSEALDNALLKQIQSDIENKITDIGDMIRGGLLNGITVIRAESSEQLERGTVKTKKLYQ